MTWTHGAPRLLLMSLALTLVACGGDPAPTDAGPGTDAGPITGTDAGPITGTDAGPIATDAGPDAGPVDTDAGPIGGDDWTIASHTCPGINRTDALYVDDADGSIWIGCGSGADGDGLHVSSDNGASWAIPATSPSNVLNSFRVLSVHRGADDLVYVAGQGPAMAMVVSLDTSATPAAAASVLTRGGTVGTTFLAGPFVTTPNGSAFAESFNGSDALYRADSTVGDAAADWTDASDWDASTALNILDLVAVGDRFVGSGSRIADPPHVYLPTIGASNPWEMTPVQLVDGLGAWDGELWGVAATASRVVAVGVDQDNNIGKIFVSGSDQYDAADYTQTDIDPLLSLTAGRSSWARGVCMSGDRIVVVGETQPLRGDSGFVLESTDGGATFSDITPEDSVGTWSKCHLGGGRLVIAGSGAIGILAD